MTPDLPPIHLERALPAAPGGFVVVAPLEGGPDEPTTDVVNLPYGGRAVCTARRGLLTVELETEERLDPGQVACAPGGLPVELSLVRRLSRPERLPAVMPEAGAVWKAPLRTVVAGDFPAQVVELDGLRCSVTEADGAASLVVVVDPDVAPGPRTCSLVERTGERRDVPVLVRRPRPDLPGADSAEDLVDLPGGGLLSCRTSGGGLVVDLRGVDGGRPDALPPVMRCAPGGTPVEVRTSFDEPVGLLATNPATVVVVAGSAVTVPADRLPFVLADQSVAYRGLRCDVTSAGLRVSADPGTGHGSCLLRGADGEPHEVAVRVR